MNKFLSTLLLVKSGRIIGLLDQVNSGGPCGRPTRKTPELLGGLLLMLAGLAICLGTTGCQKTKPAAPAKDTSAPKDGTAVAKDGSALKDGGAVAKAPDPLKLEARFFDLVLDEKKPVEKVVKVLSGSPVEVEGEKDGVTAKLKPPVGLAIIITAAPDAKPGERRFIVKGLGDQKVTLTVNVKEAKKGAPASEDSKKDEPKKDAKKDEAKKDEAKKDEAKKDNGKKDDLKKDDAKKEDGKTDKDSKKDTSFKFAPETSLLLADQRLQSIRPFGTPSVSLRPELPETDRAESSRFIATLV